MQALVCNAWLKRCWKAFELLNKYHQEIQNSMHALKIQELDSELHHYLKSKNIICMHLALSKLGAPDPMPEFRK